MRTSKTITPTQVLDGYELDVRGVPKDGKELHQIIVNSVEKANNTLVGMLPNYIRMTQKQFASLNSYTDEMFHTTDRFYRTPFNVMEVKIDRQYDTITEIDDIIEDVEQYEESKKKAKEVTDE